MAYPWQLNFSMKQQPRKVNKIFQYINFRRKNTYPFKFNYVVADIGSISGYPQVDIRDLNALTLSWNQVGLILIIFGISSTNQINRLSNNHSSNIVLKMLHYRFII